MTSNVIVLAYSDRKRRYTFEIDLDCIADAVGDLLDMDNVFDIVSHLGLIVQTLIEKIDEGYSPRRAIYTALYVLLQDLGVRKYFDFASRVDRGTRCIKYREEL